MGVGCEGWARGLGWQGGGDREAGAEGDRVCVCVCTLLSLTCALQLRSRTHAHR